MKLNKYIGLALMPMLFAACQNDTLGEEIQQQNGIYTLSGKMAGGAAMSRAQVVLGNTDGSRESFMWNEGDAFALYQGDYNSMSQHVFTISADYSETGEGDKKSATFTTDNPAQAMKYVAIYPAHVGMDGHTARFSLQRDIDFTAATTKEEQNMVWSKYLQNNMYMMAKGELNGDGENVLNFEHLCAMARITYTNQTEEDQTFDYIRLGSGQQMTTDISYDVVGGYQSGGGSTNWYQISTAGLTVAAGESTDFYFMFFPSGFNMDGTFQMALNVSGRGEMYAEIPVADIAAVNPEDGEFRAGKRYWFKLTGYDGGVVFSKDFTTEVVTIENPELAMALQKMLGSDMVTINADSTATIGLMDARSIEYLNFNRDGIQLTSLAGLEIFSNLKELNAAYVGLTGSFDASVFARLEKLELQGNQLNGLNVKGCSQLYWLAVDSNSLKEIDLSDCPRLDVFNCNHNLLTSLDLTANTHITWLGCQDNLLTSLDLSMMETDSGYFLLGGQGNSNNQELTITVKMTDSWKEVWFGNLLGDGYNSQRVVIEGEMTPAEDEVMIASTGFATALYNVLGSDKVTLTETGRGIMKKEVVEGITELNLNGQKGVTSLSGLNYFVNLKRLIADTVDLEGDLNFYQNQAIEYLDLSRNPGITSIWVGDNPNLTDLYLVSSPIYELNVTNNPNLKSLLLVDSKVSYLDMSQNPKLYHLNCRANRISELDVTANSELKQLYCGGQYDGITIKVTMTSEHKVWWDESFSTRWENERVEVYVHDANYITIKNPEFSAALKGVLGSMVILDENGYANMLEDDVLNIKELDFGWGNYQISSLAGIENFKNLVYLNSNQSGITECDLSQNVNLRQVQLRYNDLKAMDFSNNANIQYINLGWNENLVSLNIDNCNELYGLELDGVPLKELNFPNKENITSLEYWAKTLVLDLNEFPNLRTLGLYDAGFTSLDLIPEKMKGQLQSLNVTFNELTELDLTQYPNLTSLYCGYNKLKTLDLAAVPNLRVINCFNNYIEYLDITPLNEMNSLYIGDQNDNITLIVKMTDAQKERWHNEWKYWGNNGNTYPEGEEPTDEGSGSLGNFGTGGEF